MNDWVNWHALWQIVVLGLVCGAGLPALFAVGLVALNTGHRVQTAGAGGGTTPQAQATPQAATPHVHWSPNELRRGGPPRARRDRTPRGAAPWRRR